MSVSSIVCRYGGKKRFAAVDGEVFPSVSCSISVLTGHYMLVINPPATAGGTDCVQVSTHDF